MTGIVFYGQGLYIVHKLPNMKKRMFLALTGLILFSLSFAQPAVNAFEEGKKFKKEEKYANALASFKKAISLDPNY